ncbi:sugar phosphate permease [Gelidibacter algens]|uniref:Sugar phosphate permease n=1 Tax=Gelidibacter algens TaxID=49280 RepID=A0A1A7R285_9FLAO|nr:MFS transporter [Gelidibacter algens]OBX24892.1 MFS transporter permease [Gelidibacter algens]RAJ27558.1 sugar phosphate permease [Gelidibacter algens]
MDTSKPKQSIIVILLLILAGEAIFVLPFVLARIFRPTFLEVFDINNFELGSCFSVYGVVAFISYFFGGSLADKYAPRTLMAVALFMTAIGGFYMATFPSYFALKILFGYYGFTTIFLFWAPMIKATRVWGGQNKQGLAFGFLDGGRGLVAASFGSLGVLVFSYMMTVDVSQSSLLERQEAFKYVVWTCSAIIILIGILVYYFLKPLSTNADTFQSPRKIYSLENFRSVSKYPSVWLMMLIILCAYVGYKTTDIFSLYAKDVLGYDDLKSAEIGTYLLYIRPITGIAIGLLADKTRASLWIIIGFAIMLLSSLIFASGVISAHTIGLFAISIIFMAIGVYATRVLYFAILEEAKLPLAITGTAVGFISVVGYTPDIFAGPMIGVLLDNSPGELGHQHVFIVMAIFSLIGFFATLAFSIVTNRKLKKL